MSEIGYFIHLCKCFHGRCTHEDFAYACFTIGCICREYKPLPKHENDRLLEKLYEDK